jgi:hypothetical protein
MAIVNHTNYPCIYSTLETTTIDYSSESRGYWTARNWNDGHDYWYCTVFHGAGLDSIDFTKLIPYEIINDNSTFIVLCTAHEAFTDIVEPIYKNLILRLNINPKKIILISENADISNIVKEVAISYQLDTINVEWSLVFEIGPKSLPKMILEKIANTNILEKKSYKKAFLNFNRRWRIHRPCLVGLLYSMNLLDKGFVSLGRSDDNLTWANTFDTILKLVEEDSDLYSLLVDNKNELINLPDLYLDIDELVTNPFLIHEKINHDDTIKLYQESYFSIVTETNFFGHTGRFLTEKTFKPMLYKHPFILLCDPYSLTLLKQLGYKTFHPYIDESYDNEPNDTKRLKMILNEVNRLSNLSKSELFEFIDNVKEITIHNHNVLINKPKFTHLHKMI